MITLVWLIVYVVVSKGARHGGVILDPLNAWAISFIVALGIDLFRANE